MATDKSSVLSQPKPWLVILSWVVSVLLIPASLSLGFFGLMSYTDSYSHDADRWWGIVGMSEAALLFLSSVAATSFLILRKPAAWSASALLLVLALIGIGVLIAAGFGMLAAAKYRGGDWAALSILGSVIFGIICPTLAGLLAFGVGLCLWALHNQQPRKVERISSAD